MVQISDLRVGNYYNYDGSPIKLDGGFLAMYLQNDTDLYLEPIPLTEQWLLDFGYVKYHKIFIVEGHTIFFHNNVFNFVKNGIILKHVHRLQNLYFELNGIELIKKATTI